MAKDFSSFMQMMNLMSQMGQKAEARFANQQEFVTSAVAGADSTSELMALKPSITKLADSAVSLGFEGSGYNESFDDKLLSFTKADTSNKEIEKIYEYLNTTDGKDVFEDIVYNMTWEDATKKIDDLLVFKENIVDAGTNYGYKYKGGPYTGNQLARTLDKRIGQIQSKIEIFKDNEEFFDIVNQDGTVNEESRELLDRFRYDILSGNSVEFAQNYDKYITTVGNKFEETNVLHQGLSKLYHTTMTPQYAAQLTGKTLGSALESNEIGLSDKQKEQISFITGGMENAQINPELMNWLQNQMSIAEENGRKWNKQHQILTGEYKSDLPTWSELKIPGLDDGIGVSPEGDVLPGLSKLSPKLQDYLKQKNLNLQRLKEMGIDIEGLTDEEIIEKIQEDDKTEDEIKEEEEVVEDEVAPVTEKEGIPGAIPLAVTGGYAAYQMSKDRLATTGKWLKGKVSQSAKYIKTLTGLSSSGIENLQNNTTLKESISKIDKIKSRMDKLNPKSKEYINLNKRIGTIKGATAKKLSNRISGIKPSHVETLIDNPKNWSLFKLKSDVSKKYPKIARNIFKSTGKFAGGAYLYTKAVQAGEKIAEKAGVKSDVGKIATGILAAEAGRKTLVPQIKKIIASPKGKKYMYKAISKILGKKVATSVVGTSWGGPLAIVAGLVGAGLASKDIYNLILNFKEEEVEKTPIMMRNKKTEE